MVFSPFWEGMVLIYKHLVCHLAAFHFLNPKTTIAKFLAAAAETAEIRGATGLSCNCLGGQLWGFCCTEYFRKTQHVIYIV